MPYMEIEMLFAHLKRILRLDRLRLRGPLVLKASSYSMRPVQNSESWLSCSLPAFGNCQRRARICDESQLDTTLNFARPRHCAGSTGCGLISSASRVLRAIGT